MSADPATLRQSECVGKQPFPTKAAALRIAKGRKWKAQVYRCVFCHSFHIGNDNHK